MSPRSLAALIGLTALVGAASPASAVDLWQSDDGESSAELFGYVQPGWRWVQDPCLYDPATDTCTTTRSADALGFSQVRFGFKGTWEGWVDYEVELRAVPEVRLETARVGLQVLDGLAVDVGRFKVPFSRQELVSDSRQQLVGRAPLTDDAPGRQLGVMLQWAPPLQLEAFGEDPVVLALGVFTGNRAQVDPDRRDEFMTWLYAARLELTPLGDAPRRAEGDLRRPGERDEVVVSLAANGTWEEHGLDEHRWQQWRAGADVLALWQGASLYGELYHTERTYGLSSRVDTVGQGYTVQAGYFLPAPYLREHIELAGRVAWWNPADAADASQEPIVLSRAPGSGLVDDDGTQAHRSYVAGINWYIDGHDFKLQLAYTHREETEHWRYSAPASGESADVQVADDSFDAQLTYRF